MAVKSVDVFSTGCVFNLSWLFRRDQQSDEDWADLQHLFFQPGRGIRSGRGQQTGLMFGVQFPDGSKASTGTLGPHGFVERGQEPEPPALVLNNGGGGGGEDEFQGTGSLWLWPLPLPAASAWFPSGPISALRKRPSCSTAGSCGMPQRQPSSTGRRRAATMGDFTGLVLFVLFGAVFFYILYGVIRAAVRDGIVQADERHADRRRT
ncbi:hypothetical protein OUO20_01625 [Arthrobacter sp. FX8]|uniref:hypothetical protein n=1 Tax=Arthrobacter sp. FX8 TaxID=2997335 RepID=UPI00227CD842|nr:hypothetical protein [Arthrobacter sp. FX8]WAJ33755.1 hypothetical protein OUO20_01625 [Arthrobacter sp. FX8]